MSRVDEPQKPNCFSVGSAHILCSHRELCEAKTAINAALAKPPRQCDVGTAREQDARLWSYCAETRCGDTLCRNGNCSLEDIRMCALRWAQMPYEANKKGEVDDSNG